MFSRAIVTALVLQSEVNVDVDLTNALGGGAVGAFLTTLVVGAVLVALAPDYTETRMAEVVEDPVGTFAYGIAVLLVLAVLIVALVFSIIGILFVIPLIVVAYVVWAFGSAVAFLAIADRLVDREGDDWLAALLVAALLSGALVATGVGSLLALAIGAAGFGAVIRHWLE